MLELLIDVCVMLPKAVARFLIWLWEEMNAAYDWFLERITSRKE